MVFDLKRFVLLFSRWVCDPEPLPSADRNLLVKFSFQFLSLYLWSLTELKLSFIQCKMRKSPKSTHFWRWNYILCVLKNMVDSGLLFYQQHHHSTSPCLHGDKLPEQADFRPLWISTHSGWGGGEEGALFLFKHDPGSLCSLCTTVLGLHVYVNEWGRFWVSVHLWVYTICRTCTDVNITII